MTGILAASSQTGIDVVMIAAVFGAPVVAAAIYVFGFRSARKHDAENPPRRLP